MIADAYPTVEVIFPGQEVAYLTQCEQDLLARFPPLTALVPEPLSYGKFLIIRLILLPTVNPPTGMTGCFTSRRLVSGAFSPRNRGLSK